MPSITANGLQLEYAVYGAVTQPTIVLIRGLGTQMVEWSQRFIQGLQSLGLAVVIFDNRDAGLSTKLEDTYQLSDMAVDTVELMHGLGIESAHIFGISMGGMIAQLVAYQFPAAVQSLFSVMSTSGNPELPPMTKEAREHLLQPTIGRGRDAIIAQTAANAVFFGSPGYPESAAVRMRNAARSYDRCYAPDGVSRQMLAILDDGSRVDRLQQIAAPALVIHGAADSLVQPHFGADTARHIPGAEYQLVPGMGHNIPDALAPDIVRRVGEFLRARKLLNS